MKDNKEKKFTAEVASGLAFEDERLKEKNYFEASDTIHCLHCEKDIKREEFVRHLLKSKETKDI